MGYFLEKRHALTTFFSRSRIDHSELWESRVAKSADSQEERLGLWCGLGKPATYIKNHHEEYSACMLKIREVEWRNQVFFEGGPMGKDYGFMEGTLSLVCLASKSWDTVMNNWMTQTLIVCLKHTGIHRSKNWGTQDPFAPPTLPPVRHPATSMHLSYRLASKSRKRRRGGHLLTSIHFILFFSTSLLRYCPYSVLCERVMIWYR